MPFSVHVKFTNTLSQYKQRTNGKNAEADLHLKESKLQLELTESSCSRFFPQLYAKSTPPLHLLKSEIMNPFPPLPTQSSVHPVHPPLKTHPESSPSPTPSSQSDQSHHLLLLGYYQILPPVPLPPLQPTHNVSPQQPERPNQNTDYSTLTQRTGPD